MLLNHPEDHAPLPAPLRSREPGPKKHETIAFRSSLPIRETYSNTAVTEPESDLLHSTEQNVRFLSCGVPLMELPTSDSRPLALARDNPTTLVTHGRITDGCADALSKNPGVDLGRKLYSHGNLRQRHNEYHIAAFS